MGWCEYIIRDKYTEVFMIQVSRLNELFNYNSETGDLIRNKTVTYNAVKGSVAGHKKGNGYIEVCVDGVKTYAHRIIWLMVNGSMPEQIDHINQNRSDNRLSNLRCVDNKTNNKNQTKRSTNTSGFTGVTMGSYGNKWIAQITVNHVNIYLGSFTLIDDAIKARKKANIKYGFHINHGKNKREGE